MNENFSLTLKEWADEDKPREKMLDKGKKSLTNAELIAILLRSLMLRHGFNPIDSEWWHFTLNNEPYPDTYFEFPVKML